MLFSSLFNSSGVWLSVSYLAGVMLLAVFRPSGVVAPHRLRIGVVLFMLHLMAPSVLQMLVVLATTDFTALNLFTGQRGGGAAPAILFPISGALDKVLLAFAFYYTVSSLDVFRRFAAAAPAAVVKDDLPPSRPLD